MTPDELASEAQTMIFETVNTHIPYTRRNLEKLKEVSGKIKNSLSKTNAKKWKTIIQNMKTDSSIRKSMN